MGMEGMAEGRDGIVKKRKRGRLKRRAISREIRAGGDGDGDGWLAVQVIALKPLIEHLQETPIGHIQRLFT